jgi:hypothetical protein
MSRKKTVIAAVMVVIGLPLVLALRHQLYDRLLRG